MWIHPVKSLGAIEVQSAFVDERGLRFDRRWMLVDETNRFLTQRQFPRMASLRTSIADALKIRDSSGDELQVPLESDGPRRTVEVWRDQVSVLDCGDDAANWFSNALETRCRLVQMDADSRRFVDEDFAPNGTQTSLSDGFPFLIISQASLDDLNDRILENGGEPCDVERFRPNFLVAGARAYEEDEWRVFKIGEVEFEVVKPCSRCVITTLDQRSGERLGAEPLRTLNTYRRKGNAVYLAQNALARTIGTVNVGEKIEVLSTKTSGD